MVLNFVDIINNIYKECPTGKRNTHFIVKVLKPDEYPLLPLVQVVQLVQLVPSAMLGRTIVQGDDTDIGIGQLDGLHHDEGDSPARDQERRDGVVDDDHSTDSSKRQKSTGSKQVAPTRQDSPRMRSHLGILTSQWHTHNHWTNVLPNGLDLPD